MKQFTLKDIKNESIDLRIAIAKSHHTYDKADKKAKQDYLNKLYLEKEIGRLNEKKRNK